MYDRNKSAAPWWQEAFVLTKAVLGVLFWPLAAIFIVMAAVVGLFVAFEAGTGWGLLALAMIGAGIAVFRWWDRRQPPRF
jgi:hypothetical protein